MYVVPTLGGHMGHIPILSDYRPHCQIVFSVSDGLLSFGCVDPTGC